MTTRPMRQWYYFLIDQELLKDFNTDGNQVYRLCRSERLSPNYIDWNSTWRKVRLPFLTSNTATFLWKLFHELLTTEERLCNTLGNIPSDCRYGCQGQEATLEHCFFKCHLTNDVGLWILGVVRRSCPTADDKSVLKFNFSLSDSLLWTTANTLQLLWTNRAANKKLSLTNCLIQLHTEALRLEETNYKHLVPSILEIVDPAKALS